MRLPININLPLFLRKDAQIEVGGVDLASTCGGITIRGTSTDVTTVQLDLLPDGVQLTGDAAVTVTDATRGALIALGWAPPPAMALLRELVDDDPCTYDHNDTCQTHMHGKPCANARAIDLITTTNPTDETPEKFTT